MHGRLKSSKRLQYSKAKLVATIISILVPDMWQYFSEVQSAEKTDDVVSAAYRPPLKGAFEIRQSSSHNIVHLVF